MSLLKRRRLAAGLSQTELAARAGVSRQLIGAVEAGRHLPRVDAAIALADALDVAVDRLFGDDPLPVDADTGDPTHVGSVVRLGRVGDTVVSAPVRLGESGFEPGDAVVEEGGVSRLSHLRPGLVVLGCEPGLLVLEQVLREQGSGAVSVASSTRRATEALAAGRCHAAVVHGSRGEIADAPAGVRRLWLASWRVGLAGPADGDRDWWRRALGGTEPVIQREEGAGVQATFLGARTTDLRAEGPIVGSHLEAARRSIATGRAAVTIEPTARAVGARFHPLDEHEAELWVDERWFDTPVVRDALDVLVDRRLQARLSAVGGYDLSRWGSRVA